MKEVFLLTSGDGSDGDEWHVEGIFSTEERALEAKRYYERPRKRLDGTQFSYSATIETWFMDLDPQKLSEGRI